MMAGTNSQKKPIVEIYDAKLKIVFRIVSFFYDEKKQVSKLTLEENGNQNHTRVVETFFSKNKQVIIDTVSGSPHTRPLRREETFNWGDIKGEYAFTQLPEKLEWKAGQKERFQYPTLSHS